MKRRYALAKRKTVKEKDSECTVLDQVSGEGPSDSRVLG